MKFLLKVVLSTFLCTSIVTAAETEEVNMERLILLLSTDDSSNNVNPNGFIPFYWNRNFFSGVGYETGSSRSSNQSGKPSFAPSKFNSLQSSNHLWLNLISYQNRLGIFGYSIGAAYSYRKIDRDEFGYFTDRGTLVSLTNKTELELVRPGLYADIALHDLGDFLSLRLGGYLYPYSTLSAKQDIDVVSSLAAQIDHNKKRKSQELSYRFIIDAYVKTGSLVDFSFSGRYEYLPLEYTVLTPGFLPIPGNYPFQPKSIKSKYTSLRFDAKALFPHLSFHGVDPMLGFGYEKIKNTLSLDITNAPERSTQKYFVFGFEKLF